MERLAAISDFHEKRISAVSLDLLWRRGIDGGGSLQLAFSADGKKLVSAGMDPKHCIVLWCVSP